MTKLTQSNYTANKVFRAEVLSTEDPAKGFCPTKGGWLANLYNVGPELIQYRCVSIDEKVGSIFNGGVHHRGKVLVDARVPALQEGDIVDVAVRPYDEINYSELKGTTVFRLVCRAADETCKSSQVQMLGKLTGVIVPGKGPDLNQFVFIKVYDTDGKGAVPLSEFSLAR